MDRSAKTIKAICKFIKIIYSENFKQYIKYESSLTSSIISIYNIVWGQCSKLMCNKLMIMKGFVDMEMDGDLNILLKQISTIHLQIKTNASVYNALERLKCMYYTYRQEESGGN